MIEKFLTQSVKLDVALQQRKIVNYFQKDMGNSFEVKRISLFNDQDSFHLSSKALNTLVVGNKRNGFLENTKDTVNPKVQITILKKYWNVNPFAMHILKKW